MGYVASNITKRHTNTHQSEPDILALIEEGYLKSSFIYSYYDDIDLLGFVDHSIRQSAESDEIETLLESVITDEDILYYFETEDNY